jgi:hypothetical protein
LRLFNGKLACAAPESALNASTAKEGAQYSASLLDQMGNFMLPRERLDGSEA